MNPTAHRYTQICTAYVQKTWFHLAVIVLAGTAAYSNTFNVPFVLDDNFSIEYFGNRTILDLLLHGTARRVADLSFALNYKIHGAYLPGYHATNLAIHLAAACSLYFICRAALDLPGNAAGADDSSFLAAFVPFGSALLFAVHPVQTQAVTYTIQRYTSLAALFYLFSVLAYITFRSRYDSGHAPQKIRFWGCVSLLSAVLALGSKQSAATLPVTLIAVEYVLFSGRFLNRRFFAAIGLLLMIVPLYLMYQWLTGSLGDYLFDLRHATSDNIYMSRTTYFLTQTRVVATYLRLLLFPLDQSLYYDYPVYSSALSGPVLLSLVLHGSLIMSAFICLLAGRDRSPEAGQSGRACLRLTALGIAWFYITLAVESSFIPIRDVIFEHRLYLPSAGFFMAITALTALAVRKHAAGKRWSWTLLVISSLVLGSMTFARNRVWGDSLTLWQDTAKKAPNNGLVLISLAYEYLKRNMPDKSLPLFMRGNELDMGLSFRCKLGIGLTLKALNVYGSRFSTGEEYILAGGPLNSGVLDLRYSSEWAGVIHNNMGLAYEYLQEPGKALLAYKAALTFNPAYVLAWYNLALFASGSGDTALASMAAGRLRLLNPALASTLKSLPLH